MSRSDRRSVPVGSTSPANQERLAPSSATTRATKTNGGGAPPRVTGAAVQRLAARLSDHDRLVLDSLRIVRVATGEQLRRLHWADTDTGRRLARRHLAKLTELRFIARLDRRVGGVRSGSEGFIYNLDVAGQKLTDRSSRTRRPTTPGSRFLDHALAVTETYVQLVELTRLTDLDLLGFESEPDAWRTYPGPDGRSRTLKPDAFAALTDTDWEHRWFVEVDRDTEHVPTILRQAAAYVSYWRTGIEQQTNGVFPRVLWVVPTTARATELTDALATLASETWQLFQVTTLSQFAYTIHRAVLDSGAPP